MVGVVEAISSFGQALAEVSVFSRGTTTDTSYRRPRLDRGDLLAWGREAFDIVMRGQNLAARSTAALGSFLLGTVVQPLGRDEYDVDLVCRRSLDKSQVSQEELKEGVRKALSAYLERCGAELAGESAASPPPVAGGEHLLPVLNVEGGDLRRRQAGAEPEGDDGTSRGAGDRVEMIDDRDPEVGRPPRVLERLPEPAQQRRVIQRLAGDRAAEDEVPIGHEA